MIRLVTYDRQNQSRRISAVVINRLFGDLDAIAHAECLTIIQVAGETRKVTRRDFDTQLVPCGHRVTGGPQVDRVRIDFSRHDG